MQKVKLESGKKNKILPNKKGRKSVSIRVLTFGASVCVHIGKQQMNVPGNEGLYIIESVEPWDKDIEVSCENDADIEVLEDE